METAKNIAKEAVTEASTLEKKAEKKLTLLWHEIAPWQRDNQYIHSGYRPASNSYLKSASSLGYLHNETVNIYTHLFGALLAVLSCFPLYHQLHSRYELAGKDDVLVFSCFFFGAAACLGISATYHTISNHSEIVQSFGNKLDYLGIVFLIWGSFIPSIYYGFQADPRYISAYWTMITTIGAGCGIVCVSPRFRTSEWRPLRAGLFVAMGLSAVVPVLHGSRLYGLRQFNLSIGLSWLVLQGALYIAGAAIYAARIPERLRPGRFDIWGSSHQIFHVLVVLAAFAHLVGLLKAFDYQHGLRDPVSHRPLLSGMWY
ncbi:hypothetical protein H2201_001754 [Coniosporium apollinis]|uniref:HlyIII-domain-containing protein n=2 Tax=Coniosporium TaxID=2810619 RepID=A0ABQ9P021_9PEZI|nr:hypothetical protein H2199_000390 [Cladosporium sp. JES 115]KAJ9667949.1 hypothetical protein H2201_001754 [Coniosporium apollinis]